jgi:hypothetical protein
MNATFSLAFRFLADRIAGAARVASDAAVVVFTKSRRVNFVDMIKILQEG